MKLEIVQAQICKNIKLARKRRGLTQEDLDVDGGVGVATIRRIETLNLTNIELSTMLKIAMRLNIHPRDLFDIEVPWPIKTLPQEAAKRKRRRRP